MKAGLSRLREYGPFVQCVALIVGFVTASALWSTSGSDDRYYWVSTLLSPPVFGALVGGSIVVIGWHKTEAQRVRAVLRDRVEEVVAAWDGIDASTSADETWRALLAVASEEHARQRLDDGSYAFVWDRAQTLSDLRGQDASAGARHRAVRAELDVVYERVGSPRFRFAVHARRLPDQLSARRAWQQVVRRLEAQVIGQPELWERAIEADEAVQRFLVYVLQGSDYEAGRSEAFTAAEQAVDRLARSIGSRLVDREGGMPSGVSTGPEADRARDASIDPSTSALAGRGR